MNIFSNSIYSYFCQAPRSARQGLLYFLQAVTTVVDMNNSGDYGIHVPDYVEENVYTKVVKIIQSYTGVVNEMSGENSDLNI